MRTTGARCGLLTRKIIVRKPLKQVCSLVHINQGLFEVRFAARAARTAGVIAFI
jgi:hypothetical protein